MSDSGRDHPSARSDQWKQPQRLRLWAREESASPAHKSNHGREPGRPPHHILKIKVPNFSSFLIPHPIELATREPYSPAYSSSRKPCPIAPNFPALFRPRRLWHHPTTSTDLPKEISKSTRERANPSLGCKEWLTLLVSWRILFSVTTERGGRLHWRSIFHPSAIEERGPNHQTRGVARDLMIMDANSSAWSLVLQPAPPSAPQRPTPVFHVILIRSLPNDSSVSTLR